MSKGYCGQCGGLYSDEVPCECQSKSIAWMNEQTEEFKRHTQMTDIIRPELDKVAHAVIEKISQRVPVAGFSWQIRLYASVSNTHQAPQNGVQNFTGDPDLPIGYPGFVGRVWIRYGDDRPKHQPGSEPFWGTLTYTGTGGSGGYNGPWTRVRSLWHKHREILTGEFAEPSIHSWDYIFFLADWPDLEKRLDQQRIISALTGESEPGIFRYLWTDPEYVEQDRLMSERILATVPYDQDTLEPVQQVDLCQIILYTLVIIV